MKIVCISGHARNGKDTAAEMLKKTLEENGQRVLITHYADLLKYICKTFFGWNGEKDEAGRTLLQYVGTDLFRNHDPDFWVRFMVTVLWFCRDEWDFVIIPDCRFPNEIDNLKRSWFFVTHLRIVRSALNSGLTPEQQNHPSETALDDVTPDVTIYNNRTLEDLKINVDLLAMRLLK